MLAAHLISGGLTTAAVIQDRSPIGERYADFFEQACGMLGIELVASAGGDGTNHQTISGLVHTYGDAKLPYFAMLRGGTMNTVANSFGIPRHRPETLLSLYQQAYARRSIRPMRFVERNVLRVADHCGFIFGTALAVRMGLGFVPIRKPGKLPWKTHSVTYDLEYGTDSVEIHQDAVTSKDRVLLIDDLLATGGTIQACHQLIQQLGATVAGCLFVIELTFLNGRTKLPNTHAESLIEY